LKDGVCDEALGGRDCGLKAMAVTEACCYSGSERASCAVRRSGFDSFGAEGFNACGTVV
jgi:hypothetical protein